MKSKVYTIGSFSGWRDSLKEQLSDDYVMVDPRDHRQSSIARLVTDDMDASMNCPVSLVYIPEGKRAGTMSYAELGASWASGNYIISANENIGDGGIIESVASLHCSSMDDAIDYLEKYRFHKSNNNMKVLNRTQSQDPCVHVLFAGDETGVIDSRLKEFGKSALINPKPDYFEKIHNQVDLIVANFDKGHQENGLFYMGAGYALGIPVVMLEGNNVPYPPLLGLARRVMVGEKRKEQLEFYLENLGSQQVGDEALVYYDLMKKFN
jgi:hypothetical protein